MAETCYVLDSEGLSRAVSGERAMLARLKDADRVGIGVVTSSMTLIEAYHSRIRRLVWDWRLSRIEVEPVTREIADAAITLLADTGLHGHKYAIDAALAVIAGRRSGDVVLYTSDADDMAKLCAPRVRIRAL
ncbi:PIN domain-containing protein [Streptomyces hypolithicus]